MSTENDDNNVLLQHETWKELSEEEQKTVRRAALASFLGNFVEWFDYGSYIYFAVAISHVFFPEGDQTVALIQTYAVFAISFLLRPIGAIVWGALGDKKGRKWSLAVSIMLMTGATFCIALLPSYETAGLLAPGLLLLLRGIQGFSASGEYAGAATFLAEYAPTHRRGIYCSLIPASTASGLLLASFFHSFLAAVMDQSGLAQWGWRLPFMMALPLGLLALWLWMHLEDSPTYEALQERIHAKSEESVHPMKELFTTYWKETAISFGVSSLNAVGFYMILTYMPNYLNETIKIDASLSSTLTSVTLIFYILCIFYMGHLSDTFGRKKMLIVACLLFIVLTVPGFMLLGTKNTWIILVVELILCATLTVNDGTLSSFLTETFPTRVRYTGFAFSFNMANVIFGGTAPLISESLIKVSGNNLAPAFYLIIVSIAALGAMIASKERHNKDLGAIH